MLFTFLARQMARHADIAVNRSLFDQVVEALCVVCSSDADCVPGESAVVCGPVAGSLDHEQRQQALLELYAATSSSSSTSSVAYFDTARLLQLADGARFYRVVEQVRARRGEYADVVACYWRDAARRHLTFGYVQSLVAGERPADGGGAPRLSDAERERVVDAVMDAVPQLVAIDARRTAKLLTLTLGVPARRVVDRLQRGGGGPGGEACSSDDEALYGFLRGLFDVQLSGGGGASVLSPDSEDAAGVAECYVEVMCRRSADVVAFLRAAGAANVRYRLADMTAICRRHGATAALVYLLERAGDVVGAFRLEFDRLTAAVGALCDQQTGGGAGVDASTCVVPGQTGGGTDVSPCVVSGRTGGASVDGSTCVVPGWAGGADVPLRVVPGRSGGAVSPCVVSQRTGGAASPCVVDVGGAGVAVERCVCDVLGLLQRASGQLSAADLQSAWFQLLDFLTQTARLRCDAGVDPAAAAVLKTCTRHVIAAMMSGSGLPLPAVLDRLVHVAADPDDAAAGAGAASQQQQLGDVRELLTGVLDACQYERTLLATTARLVNRDLLGAIAHLQRAARTAAAPPPLHCACAVCGRATLGADSADDVLLLGCCRRAVHRTCLQADGDESRDRRATRQPPGSRCPLCARPAASPGGIAFPSVGATAAAAAASSPVCGGRGLEAHHVTAVERLRALTRSPVSRLTVLAELAHQTDHTRPGGSGRLTAPVPPRSGSLLHSDQFALRLAAPPPPPD